MCKRSECVNIVKIYYDLNVIMVSAIVRDFICDRIVGICKITERFIHLSGYSMPTKRKVFRTNKQ